MPAGLPAQGTVQQEFVEHLKFDNPGFRPGVTAVVPDWLNALIGVRSGVGIATPWATPIRTGIQQSAYQDAGTSTAVAATTLTDTTKAWTVNAWTNRYVITVLASGAVTFGQIASNTATVLTLTAAGWSAGTPVTGAYYINPAVQRPAGTLFTRDNWNPSIIRGDGNTEAA